MAKGNETFFTKSSRLLDSLELLHYAEKFRGKIVLIWLLDQRRFTDITLDLRSLTSAGISALVLVPEDSVLIEQVALWHQTEFSIPILEPNQTTELLEERWEGLRLLPLPSNEVATREMRESIKADRLQRIAKVFVLSPLGRLEAGDQVLRTITRDELKTLSLSEEVDALLPPHFLDELLELQNQSGRDLVFLPQEEGAIFEELFTHRGKGTLLSAEYENVCERATERDASEVFFLLYPWMRTGAILETLLEEILREIHSYWVFRVNGQIVASVRAKQYGEAIELGKLATLPRYQGRGRAAEMLKQVAARSFESGAELIFSLSTQESVIKFFKSLGFTSVQREELPKEWKDQYNFARGSSAVALYPPKP